MIVDDDKTTVTLLQMLFELDGFEVANVARGSKVLEEASKEKPDIFLIDYHLADMDGTALTKKLRADPQFARTPIVIGLGLNVEDEQRAGANAFTIKPYEPVIRALFRKLPEKPRDRKPKRARMQWFRTICTAYAWFRDFQNRVVT
jgi:CheY-like chemotaxis protein